jgi:glycerophosphoryl diester phosphodiesterase
MLRFVSLLLVLLSFNTFADFDWQSHRGGRGIYPENTINGMKVSVKFPGVTTLELDVVMSKDQQVVVSHEPWMNEEMCLDPKGQTVSGKEVNLYKLTYAQIKEYDCGSKTHPRFPRQQKIKEHKPLLKDLIKELRASGKKFNIEIKSTEEDEQSGYQPEYKKFTDLVMNQILEELSPSRFTIQSFDWRVLRYLHEKYPNIEISALRESKYSHQNIVKELGFAPQIFSPDYELLSAADVAYFHKNNIKVIPWTVNSPDMMNKMIAMHVDGIITDYPDLIAEIPVDSYQHVPECPTNSNRFENKCIKIPTHAVASEQNPGWKCKPGHVQKRDGCVKIKLPRHARFEEDGKTWVCKEGYERYRSLCKRKK